MITSILILGIVRGILIALVLRYVGKYIDTRKPKNKVLKKLWKDEKNIRKLAIKYAWHIGLLIFIGHFVYALISSTA